MVKTEIAFRAFYRDLPLFRDLDAALGELGFTLLALENAYYPESIKSRAVVANGSGFGDRGEWLWGDAVYVRDPGGEGPVVPADSARTVALVLVLESLGFVGYALEASLAAGDQDPVFGELAAAIRKRHRRRWFDRRLASFRVRQRLAWRLAGRVPHAG